MIFLEEQRAIRFGYVLRMRDFVSLARLYQCHNLYRKYIELYPIGDDVSLGDDTRRMINFLENYHV